jgi:glycosyltransferase involved in cell wall biosynthesis
MKFSITTPVTYNKDDPDNIRMPRYEMFLRCANSVFGQVCQDFEWVIADDISNPSVESVLEDHDSWWKPKGLQVKTVLLPEKSGRIIGRNAAMKASSGDWITWLDADDEYASFYLSALEDAIRLHPEYKVFNFNHLIIAYDYKVHQRKFINMDVQKDFPFPSGTIGAGAFVFHRSVYEEIGPLPEKGIWDLADWAFEKFPEVKPFYLKAGTTDQYNSLGNPWGEDWLYFYMITRRYDCKYLDFAPYYVHSRWGHRWSDDPDYVIDPGKAASWNPANR